MRSDIIRDMPEPEYMELDPPILALGAVAYWLKEIALQLALMNERAERVVESVVTDWRSLSKQEFDRQIAELQKGQNT